MKFYIKYVPLLALVSAVALPAGATSGVTQVGGEVGFTTHAMPATRTRTDVLIELETWKRNPVTADGWREVGGEAGWMYVGTQSRGKTRAAVIEEMFQAQRSPVSPSGWLEVGGEGSAVYVGVPDQTSSTATAPAAGPTANVRALGGLSRSGHTRGGSQHTHR